jgi:hypothetical protein
MAAVLACVAGAAYVYEQPQPGYIAGWVEGNSPTGSGTNYKTLAEAMLSCDQFVTSTAAVECKISAANKGTPGSGCICHGITLQNGNYQIRAAESVTADTVNGEQSWLRTPTRCSSDWGSSVLVFVLSATALYAGGGRLYHQRQGRNEWPHAAHWAELRSLVVDGVTFARSRVQGGNRASRKRESKDLEAAITKGKREGPEPRRGKSVRHSSPQTKGSGERVQAQSKANVPQLDDASPVSNLSRPPSQASEPKVSASAGGGRWVHVPT